MLRGAQPAVRVVTGTLGSMTSCGHEARLKSSCANWVLAAGATGGGWFPGARLWLPKRVARGGSARSLLPARIPTLSPLALCHQHPASLLPSPLAATSLPRCSGAGRMLPTDEDGGCFLCSLWGAGTDPGVGETGGSSRQRYELGLCLQYAPVWMDTRSPQYTWAGQGGMSASLNPAKRAGLEGCCQERPAVTSHRCRHPGRLLLPESRCGGTQKQARSEHPCPHLRGHCPSRGGQKEKTRGKKKGRCKNEPESGWKIKPEENVSRSIFNRQPNVLAQGGMPRSHRQCQDRRGVGFAKGYAAEQ